MSHKVNLSNCSLFCVIKIITKDLWITADLLFDSREQSNAIGWYSLCKLGKLSSYLTRQLVQIHGNITCQGRQRNVLGRERWGQRPLAPPWLSSCLYESEVTWVLNSCNLVSWGIKVCIITVNLLFLPYHSGPFWLICATWDRGAGFSKVLNSYPCHEHQNLERAVNSISPLRGRQAEFRH